MTFTHSYKGKFLKMNTDRSIENNTRRMLRNVGEQVADKMKTFTEPHDWKGRLTDSISWRTQYDSGDMGSAAQSSDMISKPDIPNAVDIGSACPYAQYRENGSGPHQNPAGSDEFIRNMKAWFKDKIGGNPDGEDAGHFWAIVNTIRRDGTDEKPFKMPTLSYLMKIAARESRFAGFARNVK